MAKRSDDSILDFPETDSLPDSVRGEFEALLREAHSLKGFEKRFKEVKARLQEIALQGDSGLMLRLGELGFLIRYSEGRETIDPALLIENGVLPEQIRLSKKKGEGFWVTELPRVGGDVAGRD